MEPAQYLAVARRHWPLVVVSAVVFAVVLGSLPLLGADRYESDTTLRVTFIVRQAQPSHSAVPSPTVTSTTAPGPTLPPEAPSRAMARRITTFTQLANSRTLAAKVVTALGLPYSADELRDKIRAETPLNTDLIAIRVEDPDPEQAQRIADAIAAELVKAGEESVAPPGEKDAQLVVASPAGLAGAPVPGRWWSAAALGLLAGLAAGLALALFRERRQATPDGDAGRHRRAV
jgi:capsular polysaccharide biosynthesis protein